MLRIGKIVFALTALLAIVNPVSAARRIVVGELITNTS